LSAISNGSRSDIRRQQRAALTTFLQLVDPNYSSKSMKTTNKLRNLQPQSKRNFLLSARVVINGVLAFLAGDSATELQKLLFPREEGKLIESYQIHRR
jgi:hypothetical protein